MTRLRPLAFCALLLLPLAQDPQPPPRPQPPPEFDGRKLKPIDEPFRTAVERKDLVAQFGDASPLEGIWELTSMFRLGQAMVPDVTGWMFVGRRHLSLYITAKTKDPQLPHLQSRVCAYRLAGGEIHLTVLAGHVNDEDGDILIEPREARMVRRFQLAGAQLRVWQDQNAWIDFKRVE
jgi:hypothetical protein